MAGSIYDPAVTFGKNDPLTAKIWSAQLYKDTMKSMRLSTLMGEGADKIIQVKNDFSKGKGDKITFGLRMLMDAETETKSQSGIILEGNEDDLTFYDWSMELYEDGKSVRTKSKLDLQRPAFELRTELKDALKEWTRQKIEIQLLKAIQGTDGNDPTNGRYLDLSGTNRVFDTETIDEMVNMAKTSDPIIRPAIVDGDEWYLIIANTWQLMDLRHDTVFKEAMYHAQPRDLSNPLFKGAKYFWNNCAIWEYNRIVSNQSTGIARATLMGCQAGAIGFAQAWSWIEYLADKRLPAVMTDAMYGVGRPKFNGEDYGTINCDVATNPTN